MRIVRQVLLVGVALSILLILYGVWITPGARSLATENIARMANAGAILGIYALVAILAPEGLNRISRLILSNGLLFGLLAGAVFAGEILLEYILLPQDNSGWRISICLFCRISSAHVSFTCSWTRLPRFCLVRLEPVLP
jgi:hypothetical protein